LAAPRRRRQLLLLLALLLLAQLWPSLRRARQSAGSWTASWTRCQVGS
jgi:hypothetical protein